MVNVGKYTLRVGKDSLPKYLEAWEDHKDLLQVLYEITKHEEWYGGRVKIKVSVAPGV